MKTHKLIVTTILALNLIQSAPAFDLLIGTNHFGVVFEGATISEKLQNFIVADVQRCYDAWGTNVVFHPGSPRIYDPSPWIHHHEKLG